VRHLDKSGQEDWTKRYDALMAHYGMQPTWNNTGVAHENGDVEQSHYRFKEAVDQALRIRGSREFPSRAAYDRGSARAGSPAQSDALGSLSRRG